jgi:hypothetical protein
MKKILVAIIVLMFPIMLSAQVPDSLLVQFSGVVVTADSLVPVPFATVGIKSQWRGTITDFYGFFSFVAQKKDTIEFSALGFKKVRYIIPDSLKQNHYSLIQMMSRDTITLRGAVVYPWPTKEQFKSAFLALRVPDDAMSRAQKNLSRHEMTQAGKNIKMDGQANQMYAQSQEQSRLYYAGELPPNNWLNPFAWAQFIQSWKNGDFNTKKNDDGQ